MLLVVGVDAVDLTRDFAFTVFFSDRFEVALFFVCFAGLFFILFDFSNPTHGSGWIVQTQPTRGPR